MLVIDDATIALDRLYKEVMSDLDEEGGGIRWMQGQLDLQRACLIGEYFLSAISGVGGSIHAAVFCVERHRQKTFSDNDWLARRWEQVRKNPRATREDYLKAMARGKAETDRELEIAISADHCLFHLAQALDRLAVCIAVVAALRLRLPLLRLDWPLLAAVAKGFTEKGDELRKQTPAGKVEQDAILAAVATEPAKHGPRDWLPWLLQARNTVTHRAPMISFAVLTEARGRPAGLARPFSRQPGWDQTEGLLAGWSRNGLPSVLLNDEPTATLGGLTQSVAQTVAVLMDHCTSLLLKRRAEPALLVQPGSQWPTYLEGSLLKFEGYGSPVRGANLGAINVSSDYAARMRAFRIGDRWASFWMT